ncbi:MAG: hypothetical protein ABUS54_05225 [Actinomycetota bacterium]
MESLLDIATDLETRDARVAVELVRVDTEQADVDEIRTHAEAAAAFLAALPAAIRGHARDEQQAEEDRATAEHALRADELEEAEAARLRERLRDAAERAERARGHQAALELEGADRRDEAAALARRAGVVGLDAVLAWASQRRGELVLERSGLAREREAIVREASELLGSVTGDAMTATAVAGLRARLERALP